jgi:L-threonylcarbamoyladenylate synthase
VILPCKKESVDRIADYARHGPVVMPTDTLYGLCMSIKGDVKKIYILKGRAFDKKIPVGVANIEMMKEIAYVTPQAEKLIRAFMPGPLTLVLRNKAVRWLEDTVAVRIPAHSLTIYLMEKIGPITLTSANISGEKAPESIQDTMKLDVKYRVDCGKLMGKPSTIVDLTGKAKLIREGAIPFEKILHVLEE